MSNVSTKPTRAEAEAAADQARQYRQRGEPVPEAIRKTALALYADDLPTPSSSDDQPRQTTARKRARKPTTGNRAAPTNAPRFNGTAGINVMAATTARTSADTLPPLAAFTWWALWRRADDHGRVTASVSTLADDTNMSEKTVKRMTSKLKAAGLLTLEKRGSSTTHRPNLYRLHAVPEAAS